ncbi:uncharacterized protein LOC9654875 isoform X2 [Selaginella moellendorffii]|uniref:uncharacterized protein LOC9654875 isoform X2 n=1 Tax=Selaginella moellendorffii TaxID=88036 RepID=UPI000D1CC8BC|nr:uncharacterized protein LOC9654875 isoform X2 [Selaginella moellendorffii]|eukprot:XP_024524741.1 uncharacterized protein LOC9654875 isoform X2 [Selaginella moellendorffii]
MLEDYVAFYLQKYLGKYVKGVSKEALKISAWQGNVELTNMQLKPEALLELKLPIKVKAGFLGSVKLKVPWSRLGQEPVIVTLDRIFVLAEPSFKVEGADDDAVEEARYQYIKEHETALVTSTQDQGQQQQTEMNNSWLGSLIGTIISNIKLSVTNIHIRFEDTESNPEQPFAIGVTLEKLAAVTVDDNGKELFVSGGALDKINKSGELKRLAFYFDCKSKPWDLDFENLSPEGWSKAFEPGVREDAEKVHHAFLLQPVDGMARYSKLGTRDERSADKPAQTAAVVLENVTLCLSEPQYRDVLTLFDNISTFNMRVEHAHYRPKVTVAEDPAAWWQYAIKATIEKNRKASGHLSWDQLLHHARMRKQYLSSYAKCLLANPDRISINDDDGIRQLESSLNKDVIVQWRTIAHTLADQARRENAEHEKEQAKKRWWPFGWGGQSDGGGEPRGLSDDEWQQLNQAIGYQEGKPSTLMPGQDAPNMLHTVLQVQMHYNASKLISENEEELLTLSCEGLQSSIRLYSEAKDFDLKLESYKICCPEGLLAESASHLDALSATFSLAPVNEDLDWSLSAGASPCYITYHKASIDRVIAFFSSRTSVSREVAIQTAAAFQMTLDEVTRKTQQQFNEALKNRPRFSLFLDIAAPKVTIPTDFYPKNSQRTKLMLDLGHFKMKTERGEEQRISQEESEMYMCFKMQLNDVSGFLVDGDCDWDAVHSSKDSGVLPVIEKCAVFALLQQICVPHPSYPSTRVAVRVPSVAVHFSPARYHRLMQVVELLQGGSTDVSVRPWEPADFEGDLTVLAWKGMGNREAVWNHRYGVIAAPSFYILESVSSESYEHCVSLFGKQVYLIPPESVGGIAHVLALCDPEQFSKKVVESVSAVILRFKDEDTLENWRAHFMAIIRKLNAVVRGTAGKDSKDKNVSPVGPAGEKEKLFLTGTLDELKICIASTKTGHSDREQVLLGEEGSLLELRAIGSKVEFLMRDNDMAVGAALLSLEIEDRWYGQTSPSCRYLARSTISESELNNPQKESIARENSPAERFFDSSDEFDFEKTSQEDGSGKSVLSRRSSSQFYDADSSFHEKRSEFVRTPDLLPPLEDQLTFGRDQELKSFIKAQVILSAPEATSYSNIDKQVKVSLATLAFYLNRPTLVALMDFVTAITTSVEPKSDTPQSEPGDSKDVVSLITPADVHQSGSVPMFDRKDSVVKGLLGTGKVRVVFLLILDMDRAQLVLNRDDGHQLATLSQEHLHVTVKIFPASYAIVATLGNLRITDDSLKGGHPYYWLVDMRDPAGKSFVELEFVSFNEDDDDYEGYEFSLSGQLSEVRVVYLHRFIQEISSYFLGLVPADPGYIVKLKDKVGDAEKTFTQSEVQGAPAMKLDLSLNKPIVIFPKDTNSNSFLELDVLHIHVINTFQWLGGGKEDIGGIRLELISLKVENIHLVVSMNGKFGENIIKDSSGLVVTVRRTLRDLRRQLPAIDASVEVQLLKAAMSDKEYQLMIDCCTSNLSEAPNLSPPVCQPGKGKEKAEEKEEEKEEQKEEQKEEEKEEAPHTETKDVQEGSTSASNSSEVWTTLKLTVDVSIIELAVFIGRTQYTPLASIQVSGVWAAYKMSSNEEQYIMASLDFLNVSDDREGIEPELKFMVGMASDDSNLLNRDEIEGSRLVMLVLDAKLNPASQMITLRIQRPRVLLALDFLLAVAEFFIPSIADVLGSNTGGNDELPFDMKNWLFLHKSPYFQDSDEVTLSPKHALVADDENIEIYIYDGGGGRIRLTDASGDPVGDSFEGPLVVVGHGKSLRFRNVVIENARCLDRFVLLGSNSSYSASKHDGVFFEWKDEQPPEGDDESANKKNNTSTKAELTFDLQAIGPELVMHTSGGSSSDIKDQLLFAKMDIFSRLVMKGDDLEVSAKANNFCIQGRRGIYVLEPVDTNCRYSKVSTKQNLHATMSDVVCNLTFSMIQLILKLQEDAQSLILLTSKKIAVECTEFDRIWADEVRSGSSQITFWRPRAPPGFTVLGDCLTVVDEPPSKGVIAMNMNLVHLKKPVDFRLVWSSSANEDDSEQCCVWLPIAPEGYVVLGCVASIGRSPPSASPTLCVLKQLVTEWYMRDCIQVNGTTEQEWAFWRADNSSASFFPISALRKPHSSRIYELRHVAFELEKAEDRFGTTKTSGESARSSDEDNGVLLTTVTRFKLIWWDKGAKSKKSVSIWRPVTPSRCVILGDIAVEGYEPPSVAFTLQDTQDNVLLQKPLKFVKMGVIHEKKGLKPVTFWFPVAPPGYAALGCLAIRGYTLDAEASDKIRCVRNDFVLETEFSSPSLWDGRQVKRLNDDISIWPLQTMDHESKAATFVTNITQEAPPKQLAFKLKDIGNQSNTDNLVGDGEIRRVSATIFDDFGGMVAPLVNVSLNGLTGSVHGTPDAMESTAHFSMVATSYNGRCDAWEPLVEQTEGYVRYTKESTSLCSSQSQVSVAATSDLNINVSTANLNMLLDAYSSWNKLVSMDAAPKGRGGARKQTVQERKLQIVCHNDLGQRFYCRHLDEDSSIKITPIESGESETFRTPSVMSLQDPFTNESVRRKSVTVLTLALCDAEVPKDDGFGGRQYMVAVRLLPQLKTAEQHQFQYQSARTRCVNPSGKTGPDGDRVSLLWNEVFSFAIENVQAYSMEALVTDLSKGAPAGYCCIASLRELKLYAGTLETDLFAGAADQVNHHNPVGKIRFAYKFHSMARSLQDSNLRNVERTGLDPGTIQVGSSPDGPWTKLCLTLASRSSYLKIGSEAAASELGVIGGVKHLTVRSLVRLQNNTSVTMEVSLFPHSANQDSQENDTISEEVFENERFQPMLGWGSSWPGHLLPLDPGRWSKRDLSGSSQEFPQVELPLGWEWSSDWFVDTSVLDPDGWVHGFSFQALTDFPGGNYVGKLNFVRRRRWLRTRERTSSLESSRCILGSIKPGEVIGMPLACFREARQDYSLQLRPQFDGYGWTQAVLCQTRGQKKLPAQDINVRSLLTDQFLSSCLLEAASAGAAARSMWFCLDVNYTDIGKDAYIGPVRDCQLMLSAPLKIVNHLPVSAEYSVHDSSRIRGYRMQDKGVVLSGEVAEIYNADVRRPVYLSFVPEGSWHPTKDLVLISHPFWDVAKDMILENLSTKRKIKVHIEYDYEEEVTGKVLRISVPFWIDCARCPPLRLKVVDIDSRSSTGCLPSTVSSTSEEVLDDIPYSELRSPFTMISPFTPKSSGMAASLASDTFGAVSPLADLDKSDGAVEVVATDGKCYFRLLVTTALCPIKFAHTKVVTIRPFITFTNRFGAELFMKQASQEEPCKLNSYDWRTAFPVSSISETLSLQVRTESSQWSYPIKIEQEETIHFYVQGDDKKKYFIRVEVRSHQEGSKFVLVFRRGSLRGPYRIENRTRQKRLRFRQLGTSGDDWELLYPNCTRSFALKHPSGQHILELLPEGVPEDKIHKYDLDKLEETSTLDVHIRGLVLHGFKLIKLTDSDEKQQEPSEAVEDEQLLQPKEATDQLKIVLDIGKLGFSIIDQRPQEIFYLYMENFKFSILNSFQENTTRFKVRFKYLQLDDQNILSASPVIFAPDSRGLSSDENVLKASVILLNDKEEGTKVYPYVGFWVTKRAWRINVHEPVIWTAIGMYNNIQLDSLSSDSQTVEADPEIRTNLIDISEAHLRVTLQTEPGLRPRGVLGIWSPLVSLAGNTSKMAIHLSGVTLENRYMRQSEVSTAVLNHIRKDLVHQALQLLLGVNMFGVASSTLETLSKSAADLSRDEKFQQVRLKQDRLKHVSGVGDGLLRGGEALARGFAFGLSGVVKKPCNSARENGFVGFFQGIGKAFTGFVFQPLSGVLDFIALTVDGVNISYTRCFEVFTHERNLTRVRLPRAIRSDGVLLPYDERAALGQAMLQLAEDHNFGQNVVFKDPAKFSLSDFYEDHFDVPENRVVLITNRRIILITQPGSYKSIRNVSPSNPCKIIWEIPYMELLSVETAKGGQSTCYVVLHLRNDPKTFAQVIKCSTEGTDMRTTELILDSIRSRWNKYGPDRQTVMSQMRKWQQTRSMPTPRASKRALASDRRKDTDEEASDSSVSDGRITTKEVILFEQIWKSEQDSGVCCTTFSSAGADCGVQCTIWRPIVPDGYVSIGDIAYHGTNPPTVTVSYKNNNDGMFALPTGFDLVWRNWKDGYEPVTIWKPRAPAGYESLGYVASPAYVEPAADVVWCARTDAVEAAAFLEQALWHAKQPWHCYIYQVHNDALTFFVSREAKKNGVSRAAKRIAATSTM